MDTADTYYLDAMGRAKDGRFHRGIKDLEGRRRILRRVDAEALGVPFGTPWTVEAERKLREKASARANMAPPPPPPPPSSKPENPTENAGDSYDGGAAVFPFEESPEPSEPTENQLPEDDGPVIVEDDAEDPPAEEPQKAPKKARWSHAEAARVLAQVEAEALCSLAVVQRTDLPRAEAAEGLVEPWREVLETRFPDGIDVPNGDVWALAAATLVTGLSLRKVALEIEEKRREAGFGRGPTDVGPTDPEPAEVAL